MGLENKTQPLQQQDQTQEQQQDWQQNGNSNRTKPLKPNQIRRLNGFLARVLKQQQQQQQEQHQEEEEREEEQQQQHVTQKARQQHRVRQAAKARNQCQDESDDYQRQTSSSPSSPDGLHDQGEQMDRSLTVMIPRAKYYPSVVPSTLLHHYQLTMERLHKRNDSSKKSQKYRNLQRSHQQQQQLLYHDNGTDTATVTTDDNTNVSVMNNDFVSNLFI